MGRIAAAVAENMAATDRQGQATFELLETIEQSRELFAAALSGTDIDPDQFVSNAVNVVKQDLLDPSKKTKLVECVPDSVIGALINCAHYGLRPGPFKEAWIIPRERGGTVSGDDASSKRRGGIVLAEFQAHYRGLQRMALAHPEVDRLTTRVVYQNDRFEVQEGSVNRLLYVPKVLSLKERGQRRAFFALASLTNGETPFVWWHDLDMVAFRTRFVKARNSPWFDGYGFNEMGRKTMLLRLLDEIPRQSRLVDLVAVDGTVRRNTDPDVPGYEVGEHVDNEQEMELPVEPAPVDLDAESQDDAEPA
jgi:recombination protein RecT